MKIIDAKWEKRNLGVECTEFEIISEENIAEARNIIQKYRTEYQIAKVPVGNVEMQLMLQEQGFRFYETNFQLERKIGTSESLPRIYSRFEKDITFRDATNEEIEGILEEVAVGDMFTTDKVALDPYFSPELSGRRYSLWARDILNTGAKTVVGLYREKVVSFTIYETKDQYFQAFIGGMINGYKNKGLGFIPLHVTAKHISQAGGGILRTGVSSNNPAILRLQLSFGAYIRSMTNVFVKHL
jgi:hypothetical protein